MLESDINITITTKSNIKDITITSKTKITIKKKSMNEWKFIDKRKWFKSETVNRQKPKFRDIHSNLGKWKKPSIDMK